MDHRYGYFRDHRNEQVERQLDHRAGAAHSYEVQAQGLMEDENGSSSYRLTREVAELRGRLDMIVKDQDGDNDTQKEIFARLSVLEKRMAQIVLIGTLVTLVLPVIFTVGVVRIETNHTNTQRGASK